MAAMSKKDLEALEAEHGVGEDGLSYQLRLSRAAALKRGETWVPPQKETDSKGKTESGHEEPRSPKSLEDAAKDFELHPLAKTRLYFTPMIAPNKDRAIYFEEQIGPEMEVEEVHAGALLQGAPNDLDRISGSYKIIKQDPNRSVTAKAHIPKIGQEISWLMSEELVPVVRGNDGQTGYIWKIPTHKRQVGDTMIQVIGLKTLITQVAPELLEKFSGKPMMMYVDGYVLAASIPLTEAALKEWRRKELQDEKLGLR